MPPSTLHAPDYFHEAYLAHHRILPVELTDAGVRVLVAGAPPAEILTDLAALFNAPVLAEAASVEAVEAAIRKAFAAQHSVVELVRELGPEERGESLGAGATDIRSLANQPPVVRYVNLLIREDQRWYRTDASANSAAHRNRSHSRLRAGYHQWCAHGRGQSGACV